MRILKVEPGEIPYEKDLDNTLSAIQNEVGGGLFEIVRLDNDMILCCNEEGKLNGMEMNRRVEDDIICGPFFLVGESEDGDFQSLSDEQMELGQEMFAQPEQFADYEQNAEPSITFYSW